MERATIISSRKPYKDPCAALLARIGFIADVAALRAFDSPSPLLIADQKKPGTCPGFFRSARLEVFFKDGIVQPSLIVLQVGQLQITIRLDEQWSHVVVVGVLEEILPV